MTSTTAPATTALITSLYPEFWSDFEELTGLKVPDGDRYSFFSCSC